MQRTLTSAAITATSVAITLTSAARHSSSSITFALLASEPADELHGAVEAHLALLHVEGELLLLLRRRGPFLLLGLTSLRLLCAAPLRAARLSLAAGVLRCIAS